MHSTAFDFLKSQIAAFGLADKSVLEVGSSQENDGGYGNAVRNLFTGPYWGIDRVPGPGVDHVLDIEGPLDLLRRYDVVLSAEMLEHTPRPWLAIENMARALAPGGSLLLTCRGYDYHGCAPVHMEPHDYWRFSRVGVEHMLTKAGLRVLVSSWDLHPVWRGVLAHAAKP